MFDIFCIYLLFSLSDYLFFVAKKRASGNLRQHGFLSCLKIFGLLFSSCFLIVFVIFYKCFVIFYKHIDYNDFF